MTVALDIQDSSGDTITTLELFDDVYQAMQLEAAINGVDVREHIIAVLTGHMRHINDDLKDET